MTSCSEPSPGGLPQRCSLRLSWWQWAPRGPAEPPTLSAQSPGRRGRAHLGGSQAGDIALRTPGPAQQGVGSNGWACREGDWHLLSC